MKIVIEHVYVATRHEFFFQHRIDDECATIHRVDLASENGC